MSQYPDFSQLGYQIDRELGRNRAGGRITHLAATLDSQQKVVIKEFRFADIGADWSGFQAYEREIQVLQQLQHPRIPRYLDSLETTQGFCLIQEYKNAPSLATGKKFTPEQIKQIAISVLEILVYLQKLNPPIFHRDIKPENILVDEACHAYLVDFGFARVDDGQTVSSVAAGTPGFMPPEAYYGRDLSEASDLYSLGVTLICLLTNTRSTHVSNLLDDDHLFDLGDVSKKLSSPFLDWLEKMVEPNPKKRFANAEAALSALESIHFVSKPLFHNFSYSPPTSMTFPKGIGILALASFALVLLQGLEEISVSHQLQQQQLSQQQRSQLELQGEQIDRLLFKQEQLERQLERMTSQQRYQTRRLRQLEREQRERERLLSRQRQQASLLQRLQTQKECNNCDLQEANFSNINLQNISLKGANLRKVNLNNFNLGQSNLSQTNLQSANLESSDLQQANLANANLTSAKLKGANLQKVNLSNAQLKYTSLNNADLRGADLRGANLRYARLNGADLRGANLRYTNLERVNLTNVKLTGAIMPDGSKHK